MSWQEAHGDRARAGLDQPADARRVSDSLFVHRRSAATIVRIYAISAAQGVHYIGLTIFGTGVAEVFASFITSPSSIAARHLHR